MNIIRKNNDERLFDEAGVGEIFEYRNNIFMKFENTASNGHVYNAICLENGIITCFIGDEVVRSVNADLVIH